MSKELIQSFYESFQQYEGEAMAAMYDGSANFSDPVFRNLNASEAGSMWKMLIEKAKGDLSIEFHSVEGDDEQATCIWEAKYPFSKTGRRVHNIIRSEMKFSDGKIIDHRDRFDFWKWTRMALGIPGVLLGWTPIIKNKVRAVAMKGLADYIKTNQA